MRRTFHKVIVAGVLAGCIGTTQAALYVYPANNQSKEQQQKDTQECQQWAQQQTGVNPNQTAQAPQTQQQ